MMIETIVNVWRDNSSCMEINNRRSEQLMDFPSLRISNHQHLEIRDQDELTFNKHDFGKSPGLVYILNSFSYMGN